jgi:hypothetical protein
MDKEFSWNLPDINAIRERREREQLGLAESEALKARRALQFQNMLEGARQAEQDQMAEQAQRARWMELENKFAQRTMDPKMKMAAMLAMAGQPGLLQQMFMSDGAGGKEAQGEMDNLEASIANDMFALAGADNDTYAKLMGALIPLYKSKYEDLLKKGAKSRMGTSWDEGWGLHLSRGKEERKRRKGAAAAKKASEEGLLP